MQNRGSQIAASLAGCALLTATSAVVLAGTAEAAPWNCPISGSGVSRSTICYQGGGSYRVAIQCRQSYWPYLWTKDVYGPWMPMSVSKPSVQSCTWPIESVMGAWAQVR